MVLTTGFQSIVPVTSKVVSSVYFSLFCLLVSSVSNFCSEPRWAVVVTFFRLTCSVVLWGGRNTANKYHWRVCGVLIVSQPHWVCPLSQLCAFSVYTAQAPGCSAGELSKAVPGLHALPRSMLFRFWGTLQRHRLGWACVLCPSQV